MNKNIKEIYDLFTFNCNNPNFNDIEYKTLSKKVTAKENKILKTMTNSIGQDKAIDILDDYIDALNNLSDYYKFKDFELYFFVGIKIGLNINEVNNIDFQKIIHLMESNEWTLLSFFHLCFTLFFFFEGLFKVLFSINLISPLTDDFSNSSIL